jgi:heat shock protein HslJ
VGGNTSQIQILKNNVVVLDNAAFRDSVSDCDLQTAGIVTYGIQAINDAGGSATDQAQVTVVESAPDNPLAGTQWQLEIYTINEVPTPLTEQQPVVSLDFEPSGQYAGFSGCNTYGGTYTVNGSQIALTEPKKTKKSCDPTINQLEATYLSLLPTFTTYQVTPEGKLILTDATGETIFTYEPLIVATPF